MLLGTAMLFMAAANVAEDCPPDGTALPARLNQFKRGLPTGAVDEGTSGTGPGSSRGIW